MSLQEVTIKTDSPEIHRKALMLSVRQYFKEVGLKNYMSTFVDRFPVYKGRESIVKNVWLGRQDDAEVVRSFQALARELQEQESQKAV